MDIKRYVRDHEGLMNFLALIYRTVGLILLGENLK